MHELERPGAAAGDSAAPAPRLAGLATALPPHVLRQADIRALGREVFGEIATANPLMLRVFDNAGVLERRSCMPIEWHLRDHGWRERAATYLEHAVALTERAALDCLRNAGRRIDEVDAVITIGTTGFAAPSLDAHLLNRIGFRPDIIRLPVFGLGCAGGVVGLARAADLARAMPGRLVLLLVVELCTLTFRRQDRSKNNFVATALFGDGAAAALVGSDGDGPVIAASGQHTWPGTLDVMGWRVEDDGFGVLFARDIPAIVRDDVPAALDGFLARAGLARSDIDEIVLHPGGAKVLQAFGEALQLPVGTLDAARDVLRDCGNMSAPTVLFVLERMLRPGSRRQLLAALGPGFTAAFTLLESA